MDQRLTLLIDDYLASVSSAVKLLEHSGIPRPSSNEQWSRNGMVQMGTLLGGIEYLKHGYGCTVHLKGGTVDFDFGANGEIDGLDAWRLTEFADGKLGQYGFESEQELKQSFESAVTAGLLVYSGYILYYLHEDSAAK